jgi:hypothetical protein
MEDPFCHSAECTGLPSIQEFLSLLKKVAEEQALAIEN